jgi:outer membrane receptor protein involved in Fe transport
VNYSITDSLTLTGGVRVFEFDVGQRSQNLPTVTRALAQPVVVTDSTESSATYKGSIEYQFAAGPLMYFTYSEGFRSGGNNEPDFTTGTQLPPYGSDKLKSYELGGKGRFFDGMLDLDLAVYMMDWEDLQQRISAGIPGSSVQMIANVGSARIKGVELGARSRPFSGVDLTMGASVTALENLITSPIPGLNNEDDRVPHVPEFTSNVFAEYGFPVSAWDGTLRAEYQYVGDSYSDFNALRPIYTPQGDYSLVNLRLNFTHGGYRIGAYIDNAFDEIGVITTTIDQRRPVETYSTRPRSVGVTLGYSF